MKRSLAIAGMPLAQDAKAPAWNPSPAAVQSGSCAAGRPGGTGLGLTIARSVAEAHGGSLSLSNRPDGGIEARLTLPRARAAAAGSRLICINSGRAQPATIGASGAHPHAPDCRCQAVPGDVDPAVRDVSFAIEKGSFVGPSGSGKNTLLNMISTEQRSTRPSSLAAIWMATLTDSSWASSQPHLKVNFALWKTAKEAR